MRILIMGLPGSGKTTLAEKLFNLLSDEEGSCSWANADVVRNFYKDWDFSEEGRIRQARRMRTLADECTNSYFIADFVAPLQEMRDIYDADFTIWMSTIPTGRFEDTNKIFEIPTADIVIDSFNYNVYEIVNLINNQQNSFWCTMATISNLYIDQGSDFGAIVTLQNQDGTPIDLSVYTVKSQFRKSYQSSVAVTFTVTVFNATQGKIRIQLSADASSNVAAGRYLYDVEITSTTTGEKRRVLEGIVVLTPEITRI